MWKLALGIGVAALLGGAAFAQTVIGTCGSISSPFGRPWGAIGCKGAAAPASSGFVLRIDGVSFILLIDGVSKLKRVQ